MNTNDYNQCKDSSVDKSEISDNFTIRDTREIDDMSKLSGAIEVLALLKTMKESHK